MIVRSIRRYLLSSLVIALMITSLVLAFTTYQSAKEELDELYNANLQKVAEVIKSQHTTFSYKAHTDVKSEQHSKHIKSR